MVPGEEAGSETILAFIDEHINNTSDQLLLANCLQGVKELCGTTEAALKLAKYLPRLLVLTKDTNETIACMAIDTISCLVETSQGELRVPDAFFEAIREHFKLSVRIKEACLYAIGVTIDQAPEVLRLLLGQYLIKAPGDLSTTATHSTAAAFTRTFNEQLWEMINTEQPLLNLIKQRLANPIPEVKDANYYLLSKVCIYEKAFDAGFYKWLLDRNTESTVKGLKWRYGILESVHRTPWFERLFRKRSKRKSLLT